MPTGFTPQQTSTILFRDGDKCAMCGRRARTANHRANRGAGGFRAANVLSNGCALCHECNGLIESDGPLADRARDRGVKISKWSDPRAVPFLSPLWGCLVLLDDDGGFELYDGPAVSPSTVPDIEEAPGPKSEGHPSKFIRTRHHTEGTSTMLPTDPDSAAR
jgi:hypothetical protein